MLALRIFLRQFQNGFFYILIAAAVISFFLGEHLDTIVITTILFLNALLGFFQEYRSQKLLEKLQSLIAQRVKVRRGDRVLVIPLRDLRIGDCVIVESGDNVPADLEITDTHFLEVDESALTGESLPVSHRMGDLILMGSTVLDGFAEGRVVALGDNTEFGKIRHDAMQVSSTSQFERDVNAFSKKLMVIVLITLGGLLLLHLTVGRSHLDLPTLLLFILALAIGIVPEAMPLVTTLAMTSGALKLAHQKVVVKKLAAVEDLGNLVILCTDKTGTVTEGRMTVAERRVLNDGWFETACLMSLGRVGLSNQKSLGPFDAVIWKSLSESTRGKTGDINIFWEDPFDPETRRHDVVAMVGSTIWAVTKGAPESIFVLSKPSAGLRQWTESQGLLGRRIMVVAGRSVEKKSSYSSEDFKHLQILGVFSFSDPLKASAMDAVHDAERLGVDVRMITGDSPEVAFAIGKELGLVNERSEVLTGSDLEQLPGEKKQETIRSTQIFARIFPSQKHDIVTALSLLGPVGFIGDGVNDAPALKAATVGIAADHATDVAREAASIILLKKDLHVVVDGIRKGREIFVNIEKYLVFTLIGDFGTFYSIAVISLLTTFLPMLPVQILLSNLLSDLPMVSIAADTVDADRIKKPVRSQLNRVLAFSFLLGLVSSFFDFLFFGIFRQTPVPLLQTLWFVFTVVTELVLIFSVRTKKWLWSATCPPPALMITALLAGLMTIVIPLSPVASVFHFVSPNPSQWAVLALLTVLYFVATEFAKHAFIRAAPR